MDINNIMKIYISKFNKDISILNNTFNDINYINFITNKLNNDIIQLRLSLGLMTNTKRI